MLEIQFISDEDVERFLPADKAVEVVEQAFRDVSNGQARMPAKVYLDLPEYGSDFRAMPAFSKTKNLATIKWVSTNAQNPAKGLPFVNALLLVNRPDTGEPIAVMSARTLTARRTGASGAVSVKYLAASCNTCLFVGAGIQAIYQLDAIRQVIQPREVLVADPNAQAREVFKVQTQPWIDTPIQEVELTEDIVGRADIIVTTTPGKAVLFPADWVQPGTHICAIGADAEGKRELDPAILSRARVVVDDWEQAAHSGEINCAVHDGTFSKEDCVGSLGEVILGQKQGRISSGDITVFDSTGLAVQDLYTAAAVLEVSEVGEFVGDVSILIS